MRESLLFQELGKLTREIHETLKNFRLDEHFEVLASEEIPEAKDRLQFVIEKTEAAAHRTLNSVEDALPVCNAIMKTSQELGEEWARFSRREMTADEFRGLHAALTSFWQDTGEKSANLKAYLNDILMAQDFQDITGQIIRRVIELVGDVESSLVDLVRLAGNGVSVSGGARKDGADKLEGPQVPGLESSTSVKSQDEVDDLLSSLGF